MKKVILKLSLFCLAALSMISITACTSPAPVSLTPTASASTTQSPILSPSTIPVTTEFGKMLGLIPYSFLQKHDAWFSDLVKVKQIYGYENITSLDSFKNIPIDEVHKITSTFSGVPELQRIGNWTKLAPVIGFDAWMVDQTLFSNEVPPTNFSILKGNFNQDLIINDFLSQGYQKVDYGSFSYLSMYDDYSPGDLSKPIPQEVLSALNRAAVFDNTIVTAPTTDLVTGTLDAIAGKVMTAIDDPACQALTESLGDVLSGVIMTPERVLNPGFSNGPQPFNFTIPTDWGQLHRYDMVGMGFKDDGQDRYWAISLHYADPAAASADASLLETRLNSYILYTQFSQGPGQSFKATPLTDKYEVGQAAVQQYSGGATLTVSLHFKPGTGSSTWVLPVHDFRDLLFLVPDPTPYVVK